MTRFARGAWSRRGALATLVAMTAVVVGGAVGVLGFAAAADTVPAAGGPPAVARCRRRPQHRRELAAARRERGLARLRGIHGTRLWRFLLLEPLGAIAVGTVLGLVLGGLVTVASTSLWLGEAADPLDRVAVLTALGIALGGLASWSSPRRPPSASRRRSRWRPQRPAARRPWWSS